MKKTLLVTLLLSLGPVAASAGTTTTDNGLSTMLDKACALQPGTCATVERKAMFY
ncbi:MAG: hypothetical protein RSE12_02730 [Fuscovulum sp.]|nr:MAG: hypothetical protein RSE12_02730 [Fuscovulum sp.]